MFNPLAANCGRRTHNETRDCWDSLAVGIGVAPALAWDGDRGLHRDIRHDQAKIDHDRRELRRDMYYGNYAAARQ